MFNNFFARIAITGALIGALSGCAPLDDDASPQVAPEEPTTARLSASGATASPSVPTTQQPAPAPAASAVTVGAGRLVADGFAALQGKRVGIITNAAATVEGRPVFELLADADGVDLVAVFAPEHGVDGVDPAGAAVSDGVDESRRIAVYSLYGAERAPRPETLADLDVLVFDLQDVGVRAYTYLSTMGLAMAAAADADLQFMVLDRPNPLGGDLLGGFVREPDLGSFIAQYPVPAVHGLSAGEMALAIKGERWLGGLDDLDLDVVAMAGWQRDQRWPQTGLEWLPPSPGLPTIDSVSLYPATVLFEATSLSVGRGTPEPFTVLGGPWVDGELLAATLDERRLPGVHFEATTFTPIASPSVPDPPWVGQVVPGVRIVIDDGDAVRPAELGVHLLEVFWRHAADRGVTDFLARPDVLDLLAGSDVLRGSLGRGASAESIIDSWTAELAAFDDLRQPYLLYG